MAHDKRDEGGMYRPLSAAEERCERAKRETQTHEGRFTHSRDATERRMDIDITVPESVPYFRNKRFNRDPWRPKVTK
jgi:hypothetical protein